jgi:redox-sensing transcriptional repressor
LRILIERGFADSDTLSSTDMEQQTGISAAQFRKDLSFFGEFGCPGVGYSVGTLKAKLADILHTNRENPVLLVGAGNLGSALVGYPGLRLHNFNVVAVFDNDPGKVGRYLWDRVIHHLDELPEVNKSFGAKMAILAVPPDAAQSVADLLVQNGITMILNLAPAAIKVPERILVREVCFIQELAVLSFFSQSSPDGSRRSKA